MGTILKILIVVIIFAYLVQRYMPAKGAKHIEASELDKLLVKKDLQFIDVRTVREFQANRVRKFKNIPLSHLMREYKSLDPSKEVVLLCQSGNRSNQAAKILLRLDFEKVTNVKGGIVSYQK